MAGTLLGTIDQIYKQFRAKKKSIASKIYYIEIINNMTLKKRRGFLLVLNPHKPYICEYDRF